MVADAMDHDRAEIIGQICKTLADLEDDAIIERIALGGPIEADGQHRPLSLDLEVRSLARGASGVGVSHRIYCVLFRIVMFYNYFRRSQQGRGALPAPTPGRLNLGARLQHLTHLDHDTIGVARR